jgi:hypothetical protein
MAGHMSTRNILRAVGGSVVVLALAGLTRAGDRPQWGEAWSRNMVSDERGLVESFDPASGRGVKWRAALGTQ